MVLGGKQAPGENWGREIRGQAGSMGEIEEASRPMGGIGVS